MCVCVCSVECARGLGPSLPALLCSGSSGTAVAAQCWELEAETVKCNCRRVDSVEGKDLKESGLASALKGRRRVLNVLRFRRARLRFEGLRCGRVSERASVSHHPTPSYTPTSITLVLKEEAGVFKSRKDLCEEAEPLPLFYLKPPPSIWRMYICQDDRQPAAAPLANVPPFLPQSPTIQPPTTIHRPPSITLDCSPAASGDLGIPAVTQEWLPPLRFSSRSQSAAALGLDPGGQQVRFHQTENLQYLVQRGGEDYVESPWS